ncbi:hypothetical protein [Persicitalea jodogahamensis]|nr:hypothetical protein [Persicitalea jodogahamensis]
MNVTSTSLRHLASVCLFFLLAGNALGVEQIGTSISPTGQQ